VIASERPSAVAITPITTSIIFEFILTAMVAEYQHRNRSLLICAKVLATYIRVQ